MPSSGMLRGMDFVRTDISEKGSAYLLQRDNDR
jgi:hypothetical protein